MYNVEGHAQSQDQKDEPKTFPDIDPREPFDKPNLTPELSRENPDLYKDRLLYTLEDSSISGTRAVHAAGIDMETLALYSDRYTSRAYANGRVDLGTEPMDEQVRHRILFDADEFDPNKEVAYRFLHEASHTLYEEVLQTPEGRALEDAARLHRHYLDEEHGLTALASLNHYSGNIYSRYKEDGTELLTMYYYGGPEYVAAYANYLCDPNYEDDRRAKGIATLTTEQAYEFVETVARAAEKALLHSQALRAQDGTNEA